MKTTNAYAHVYVARKEVFKANNLFAEYRNYLYIVYSYGRHWPLYVFDTRTGKEYINSDKRSISTSRHLSQIQVSGTAMDFNLLCDTIDDLLLT